MFCLLLIFPALIFLCSFLCLALSSYWDNCDMIKLETSTTSVVYCGNMFVSIWENLYQIGLKKDKKKNKLFNMLKYEEINFKILL